LSKIMKRAALNQKLMTLMKVSVCLYIFYIILCCSSTPAWEK